MNNAAQRRRTTVHDLAALRIHPDGTRIRVPAIASHPTTSPSPATSDLPPTTTYPAAAAFHTGVHTGHDAHGNWIALDAGGVGTVKKRHGGRKSVDAKGKKGKGVVKLEGPPSEKERGTMKDRRTRNRRDFYENLSSFLDDYASPSTAVPVNFNQLDNTAGPSSSSNTQMEGVMQCETQHPLPSSDLLKYIHYAACQHYSQKGWLRNIAREARQERKARKFQKLQESANNTGNTSSADDDIEIHIQDTSAEAASGEKSEKVDEGDERRGASTNEALTDKPQKGKRRRKKDDLPDRDMYRAFDGSALMAIGMLLQEHITDLMHAPPPRDTDSEIDGEIEDNKKRKRTSKQRKKLPEGPEEPDIREPASQQSMILPGQNQEDVDGLLEEQPLSFDDIDASVE